MASRVAPAVCRYAFSADLHSLVRCRVDRILPPAQAEDLVGEEPLDIEVLLVFDGELLRTASSQAVFDAAAERGAFRPQQFAFAAKVRDVPRNCSLVVRLFAQPHLGIRRTFTGSIALFNSGGVLRQGRQLLALWEEEHREGTPDEEHGPISAAWALESLGKYSNEALLKDRPELREALRLLGSVDLCSRGGLPAASPGLEGSAEIFAKRAYEVLEDAGLPWLSLHLPVFSFPVVFAEPRYGQEIEVPTGVLSAPLREDVVAGSLAALEGASWLLQPLRSSDQGPGRFFKCWVDHDAQEEHPAVLKNLRLSRSSRASRVKDKDARPSADELKRLNDLVRRPRRQFNADDKHLLFRFRWRFTDQPGALTKFLQAVDWSDLEEKQDAIELLGSWSPVDIDDALELLSKDFRGIREVRQHAVDRLERASDDDLQLYLLQLVQALRYEPIAQEGAEEAAQGSTQPPQQSLASRASEADIHRRQSSTTGDTAIQPCVLMRFLIRRAVSCRALATLFYWYVVAETSDRECGAIFDKVRQQLLDALGESTDGVAIARMLERQATLRQQLIWCLQVAKVNKREKVEKKIERFRQALATRPGREEWLGANEPLDLVGGLEEALPFPVDPSVSLLQVLPEQCSLLRSAMIPAVLTCQVQGSGDSPGDKRLKKIMFKEGDDLRQDQLVLQLMVLMDSILKKYGLDLELTPYRVIALSANDGIIEFVPNASNISTILKDHNNDIKQYFRTHHPYGDGDSAGGYGPHNSYGIMPKVLKNFILSSAGYCVITYILGIGDRHLDNLMVTKEGRLFHIDFGFILGKDPKPFPPPMRICKEMVEGMGGNNSQGYRTFRSKCCQAYKILRRHAKLIMNLLYLMADSGIISDPQFAILKVEQKFQALMDDEQAEEHFLSLIDESLSALFPVFAEKVHQLAVAMQ